MTIAKLFIRGIREPIELTEEQGRKANQIKRGEGEFKDLGDKDTISIGDVWTGEKGDLRYVKFEKVFKKTEETAYSSKEFFDFEKEIKSYCVKEEDDEYKSFVTLFTNEILDVNSKMFWTLTTRNSILNAREIVSKITKDNERKNKAKEEAEKIAKNRILGTFSQKGQYKYLVDQKAIVMKGNGFIILQHQDGSTLFDKLNHKIGKYLDWKSRKEYASDKEMETYAEMAGEINSEMNIQHEEQGAEELF